MLECVPVAEYGGGLEVPVLASRRVCGSQGVCWRTAPHADRTRGLCCLWIILRGLGNAPEAADQVATTNAYQPGGLGCLGYRAVRPSETPAMSTPND